MSQYAGSSRSTTPTGVQSGTSGWVGWIAFAGTMMVLLGTFHIFQGLVALFNDDYFLVRKSGLVLNVDYTVWGWAHLIGGAIAMAAGFALFLGAMWARIVAVVIALLSAIVNIGFMSAYPIWSAIMIALDVLVIYAVTVHGRDALD